MKIGKWGDWVLRMESDSFIMDSFIMVVNKHTGEYRNLYAKDFKNPIQIKHMALLLDRHKNMG